MVQTILDEVKAYFDAKENPTEGERRLQKRLSGGYFPISSVHRDDLAAKGYDTRKIDDGQMMELAARMSKDYKEQLYWDSLDVIAGEILEFLKSKDVTCPKCGSEKVRYDIHESLFHCERCSLTWDDRLYVLVEFPEDASSFEESGTGYPSWNSGDNGARYVPEEEYIRVFGKSPEPEKCYRAVCWPDSQKYIGKEEYELIQDEDGMRDFGTSAYWVPLAVIKKM